MKLNMFWWGLVQVLNQDETPLLYSLVFGEGVVNDATSVVLFNAIESFDVTNVNPTIALHFMGNFFHLFFTSTMLGVLVCVSLSLSPPLCVCVWYLLGKYSNRHVVVKHLFSCRLGCLVPTSSKSCILAGKHRMVLLNFMIVPHCAFRIRSHS